VRLWLRAGITAADLHAATDVLATACWATEVRVLRSPSHAHLVTLEVIRTRYPERMRPTPETWPFPRHVAGDGLGDTDERDTRRWPADEGPAAQVQSEESQSERDARDLAPVPDDRF